MAPCSPSTASRMGECMHGNIDYRADEDKLSGMPTLNFVVSEMVGALMDDGSRGRGSGRSEGLGSLIRHGPERLKTMAVRQWHTGF